MKKIIVVIGGVTSGVGKGVVVSSLANLLQEQGLKVTAAKFDGLLNTSFEQMNPYHNPPMILWADEEVTLLNDGSIVDSDIGVYERFTGLEFNKSHNIVNGDCWKELFDKQTDENRRIGEVISVNPHLINIYKQRILNVVNNEEICVLEVGGTVGDYESEHFIRTLVMMRNKLDIMTVLVSYVPILGNDLKNRDTINQDIMLKPAKQSFLTATSLGLIPDILLLRSEQNIGDSIKRRMSNATGLDVDKIMCDYNVETVYKVPFILEKQGMMKTIAKHFSFPVKPYVHRMKGYALLLTALQKEKCVLHIAIAGQTEAWDCYTTINEAIDAAAVENKIRVEIRWFRDKDSYDNLFQSQVEYDGFILTEGNECKEEKMELIKMLVEKNRPMLCISYGARLFADYLGFYTEDFSQMALGSLTTILSGERGNIRERHRRNFRIFPPDREIQDVVIEGMSSDKKEVHVIRAQKASHCVGVVFQPAYNSRPFLPSLWICDLVSAAIKQTRL